MNTATLCTGFAHTRIDYVANTILETCYAVLPSGKVLKSDECQRHSSFNGTKKQPRVWRESDLTKADLTGDGALGYFIGNYPIPTVTK